MTTHVTCPQGHHREIPAGTATQPCPVCGAEDSLPLAALTAAPAAPPPPAGPAWAPPGYEILEALGRGGMGVVYKARQTSLQRIVALKLMHGDPAAEPEALTRFRREAVAAAQLQHPNIIQVFDVGEQGGRPYFAMEYVSGGNLARRIARELPSPRLAAQLVEVLAQAAHHAHARGIVHRDLKPANILLTGAGASGGCEPSVRGEATGGSHPPLAPAPGSLFPKIADFGLARPIAGAAGPTRSGEVIGTPSYMAPEQAAGRLREIGPASDVYSLGAVLYECLTGRPPFDTDASFDAVQQVLYDAPVPPRRLQPRIPHELEIICLKCLQKDPDRRYSSAAALADDLRRFLTGEAVAARPAGAGERLHGWARRRPAAAALSAAGSVALAGALVGAMSFSPLAAGGVAVLGLLAGAGWYGARLRSALQRLEQAQAASERDVERLHLLFETTRRLIAADGLDAVLLILGETTALLANAERATIYLVDRERCELWSKVALGDAVGEIRVPLGQGIAGAVAATGATIALDDPYADPRFSDAVDRRTGYTTRNLLTLPLTDRAGVMLGVLQALNKRQGSFAADDIEILHALAASAALAVERARGRPTAPVERGSAATEVS